jgi:hypothetical protein
VKHAPAHEKGKAMNRQTILILLALLTVVGIVQWPSTLEAQDSCQPVFDALTKVVTTPSHSYSTHTGARQTSAETIYTQGKSLSA